jgi:hypothetical protein
MNKHSIVTLLTVIILSSCNTNETKKSDKIATLTDSSKVAELKKVSENFDDFYKKFYSDSLFQISRVKFPLKGNDSMYENPEDGKMKDYENDTILIKNNKFFWKKKGWTFLKTLKKQGDFGYKKRIEKKVDIIREDIYSDNSEDRIIRDFKQIEGKWMLVYYGSTWY